MSANFAYRSLTYQGFTKETIFYLSADTDLDLDENGEDDDVDREATNANLEYAITEWAADATTLLLYLVDHGGPDTFRMSGSETLLAADLAVWLDNLPAEKVIVVYDACESGTFLTDLVGPPTQERIVITSTSPGESAYFITKGSISFSSHFWTHVFNGTNVWASFDLTTQSLGHAIEFQHPMLDDNGDGIFDIDDGSLALTTSIGNGTEIYGEAPQIGSVSPPREISGESEATLYADGVIDDDGIARVWAVIRPPDYKSRIFRQPGSGTSSVDLTHRGEEHYEGVYGDFNRAGTYQIAIYARDRIGNTCVPELTTVTVSEPLRRRALIVAGGWQEHPLWPAIEKNVVLAYEALTFQGYSDEDIWFFSPVTISAGVDRLNTLDNLAFAFNDATQEKTQDVEVVYLVGNGSLGAFELNQTEALTAGRLAGWLDALQEAIPGKIAVVYDGCQSASFLSALVPPLDRERILLASSGSLEAAHFLLGGDISFSNYFWRKVLNGTNIWDAFVHAKNAIQFSCQGQNPKLDDNGNGIGNEKTDGQVAQGYVIGSGIILAGDDPLIGTICPAQTLTGGRARPRSGWKM